MSVVNSSNSPLETSGFSLHRGFSTSSDNMGAIGTPGNASPAHQGSLGVTGSGSSNNSPLHLATMLNNLAMSGSASQSNSGSSSQGPYLLQIKNVPQDITLRECHAIFALAHGVSAVERFQHPGDVEVVAHFDSLHLVSQYATILDGKPQIFGPGFPYRSQVSVVDELTQQHIPFNQNISPQHQLHSLPQPNLQHTQQQQQDQQQQQQPSQSQDQGQSSTSQTQHSHLKAQQQHQRLQQQQQQPQQLPQQQQQPQQPQQQQHQQSQQQPQQRQNSQQNGTQLPIASSVVSPPQSASSATRPALYGQRSRFSFSDPFTTDASQNPQNQSQELATTPLKSQDVGKSFLLMENDEINESIWGSNGGVPSSMSGLATSSQPATPSMEWGPPQRRQSSSFFSVNTNTVPTNDLASMHLSSTIPHQMSSSLQQHTSLPYGIVGHTPANTNTASADLNLAAPQQSQQQPPNQMVAGSQQQQESQTVNGSQKASAQRSSTSKNSQANMPVSQKNSSSASLSSGGGISQVDLSLLARVPPPANPADQNPPCNTLYVGNLPPDATEHELRQLFSTQKGFRRLSFRNKNTNGNGHGPMCFVEFEDVAHATRALAELYGRQLPRSGASHNNKGGIRLSFSKNPLGVRGPNSRRSGNGSSVGSNGNYSYATAFTK